MLSGLVLLWGAPVSFPFATLNKLQYCLMGQREREGKERREKERDIGMENMGVAVGHLSQYNRLYRCARERMQTSGDVPNMATSSHISIRQMRGHRTHDRQSILNAVSSLVSWV